MPGLWASPENVSKADSCRLVTLDEVTLKPTWPSIERIGSTLARPVIRNSTSLGDVMCRRAWCSKSSLMPGPSIDP